MVGAPLFDRGNEIDHLGQEACVGAGVASAHECAWLAPRALGDHVKDLRRLATVVIPLIRVGAIQTAYSVRPEVVGGCAFIIMALS